MYKAVRPAMRLGKRVDVLEEKADKDYSSITEIKETNSLLCQGMIALIDSHITGNNIDQLKKTKESMIKHLTDH